MKVDLKYKLEIPNPGQENRVHKVEGDITFSFRGDQGLITRTLRYRYDDNGSVTKFGFYDGQDVVFEGDDGLTSEQVMEFSPLQKTLCVVFTQGLHRTTLELLTRGRDFLQHREIREIARGEGTRMEFSSHDIEATFGGDGEIDQALRELLRIN